jgi:NADH:ubiquinone oxidoreductase subunit 6 (subunit J)
MYRIIVINQSEVLTMDYFTAFQIAGLLLAIGAVAMILKPWDLD